MAICTIHDLNARNPPSLPTPPANDTGTSSLCFSLADAVHLKRKLQALDNAVSNIRPGEHSEADVARITNACQTQPPGGNVYVAGSEEFYLVVKNLPSPHDIAHVCAEAYKQVVEGKPHVNNYRPSGSGATVALFSEVRPLLGDIDRICDTNLQGALARLEERVEPFPFLRLPAELRLHIYSFLLPTGPRIVLGFPRQLRMCPHLNIMRTNAQLHNEVRKYFYRNRTLFMRVGTFLMDKQYARKDRVVFESPQTIAMINPATLELLKELEIEVYKSVIGDMYPSESWTILTSNIFDLLRLERVRITFTKPDPFSRYSGPGLIPQKVKSEQFARWLIAQVPASVHISWSHEDAAAFFGSTAIEQRLYQAIQERTSSEMG